MTLFSSQAMFTLSTQTGDTNTGVAYANGKYYVGTGGGSTSPEYEEDQSGSISQYAEPNPGLDFRSLFTDGNQDVFAKGYADNSLYVQTSFGNFDPSVSLDGNIDPQQKVVFDPQQQDYVGLNGSQVQEWDLHGTLFRTTDLQNYTPNDTNAIAVFNGKWYTYDGNNVIDEIDPATGITLDSQASPVQSGYSLAIANHHLFLSDNSGPYSAYELADGNTAPSAADDSAQTLQDNAVTLAASRLLANVSDADGDLTSISSVRSGANGTAVLNNDGSVTFTPAHGFSGLASFSYRATDSLSESNDALMTIAVETPPTYAISTSASVTEGTGGPGHAITFTVSRTGDASQPGQVDLAFGGSAELGTDYTVSGAGLNNGQLAFAANTNVATVTVTTSPDGIFEADESVVATISNPQGEAGAAIGGPATATAFILNDDAEPAGSPPHPAAPSQPLGSDPSGDGNYTVMGQTGNDLIRLGNGSDTAYGGFGDDSIVAGNGNDLLFGGLGSDTIRTGNGNNTIFGGSGSATDRIDAADLIVTGDGADDVFGNGGQDTVAAGRGADEVAGGFGDDVILGNQGNDLLQGNKGNDSLVGGFADDTVVGGQGNDLILGSEGADLLCGNEGQDTFAFNPDDTNYTSGGGMDTIADFESGSDKIVFLTAPTAAGEDFASRTVTGATLAGLQLKAQKLVDGGAAFAFVSNGTDGVLFADLNGDRIIDDAVGLAGLADARALKQSDVSFKTFVP